MRYFCSYETEITESKLYQQIYSPFPKERDAPLKSKSFAEARDFSRGGSRFLHGIQYLLRPWRTCNQFNRHRPNQGTVSNYSKLSCPSVHREHDFVFSHVLMRIKKTTKLEINAAITPEISWSGSIIFVTAFIVFLFMICYTLPR